MGQPLSMDLRRQVGASIYPSPKRLLRDSLGLSNGSERCVPATPRPQHNKPLKPSG